MSDGRVINFNFDAGPRLGNQHGIIIVPIAANAGFTRKRKVDQDLLSRSAR